MRSNLDIDQNSQFFKTSHTHSIKNIAKSPPISSHKGSFDGKFNVDSNDVFCLPCKSKYQPTRRDHVTHVISRSNTCRRMKTAPRFFRIRSFSNRFPRMGETFPEGMVYTIRFRIKFSSRKFSAFRNRPCGLGLKPQFSTVPMCYLASTAEYFF